MNDGSFYFERRHKSAFRMVRDACFTKEQALALADQEWHGPTPHESWTLFRVIHHQLGTRTICKDYLALQEDTKRS